MTGARTTVLDLVLNAEPGDTFSYSGVMGTITYDHTPATTTPVPEPGTLAQLVPTFIGLLAFGWWAEKRNRKALSR
jgi:hypothetical protein